MCLGIPAKIIQIEGEFAKANINGANINVGIQLLEDICVGDYVLVHTGYALEKLSEEDALETIKTLRELEEFNNQSYLPQE
ncbi:MAG: HypC/HybG/HupF family hydrogenase formation chaperone [Bacteroidales bacterium]|nr:HypC/HybG/HupF family hydrogenase formation chaperone [Bacteroidales bacterium]